MGPSETLRASPSKEVLGLSVSDQTAIVFFAENNSVRNADDLNARHVLLLNDDAS